MTPTPLHRPRRLRKNPAIRSMVRETSLSPEDFILPLFVVEGEDRKNPISSMPGHFQLSLDHLAEEAREINTLGIPAVILFGIPARKDACGSQAMSGNSIVCRAIQALKKAVPELYVIADVCCCEYTDHGHCGTLVGQDVDNDATLELLQKQAVVLARAGVDMVAPSGEGGERAMRLALKTLAPDRKVNYINAHGTSTPVGDVGEVEAVRRVFGRGTTPLISSTKSMTGHSQGATGAQEAIYCLLMLQNDFIAPSINVETLDPAIDAGEIATARIDAAALDTVMTNSFGFGGTNGSMLMSKYWE